MFRLFVSRTTARRPRNATPQLEALEQVLSLSSWSSLGQPPVMTPPIISSFPKKLHYK